MLNKIHNTIDKPLLAWFYSAGLLTTICLAAGIWFNEVALFIVPFAVLIVLIALVNFKLIFYLLVATIPISLQYFFSNGMALNLPTEPLMACFLVLTPFYFLLQKGERDVQILKHPIIQLLLLLLFWSFISTLYSTEIKISIKFLIAKSWTVTSFAIIGALAIKNEKAFKVVFWCFFIPLLFTTVYTLVRHYGYNFSFVLVNKTMRPFFLNHVDSAVTQVAFLPFCIFGRFLFKKGHVSRLIIDVGSLLLITGIFYSYTRAAIGSLLIIVLAFGIIKYKVMPHVITAASILTFSFIFIMATNHSYLELAPEYEKTVYNENWKKHLKATVNFEDVSSMERVYRWVAAFRMTFDKPVVGFGPGTFYKNYKQYTVSSFKTYVSDNPEKSTVHNYYLLTLVEQGFIGILIFLSIVILCLLKVQHLYHSSLPISNKLIVAAAGVSLIVLLANNFLADLVEVDKTGSLLFLNMAIIVAFDIKDKNDKATIYK